MNRLTRIGALLAVLSIVAWSDRDVEAAPISAAVSIKQLKDLTDGDVELACQSLTERVALSREDACEFAGVLWSTLGGACDTVKEKCMAAPEEPPAREGEAAPPEAPATSCLPPIEARDGCTATVAEFEACLLAHADVIRSLTCDSSISALEAPIPACDLILQKCPALAGPPEDDDQGQGTAQP
ncbi:hypothetical protein SOCEGT47_059520 [Sorangium cellulosum]|uniref:Uncharacterized protein n=1 Tax=Sorangium cellulosum TaxID=56 RepID=A0A4P2Q881_SORCE|nr:hypothetical protein [Sorangium cellulosum]AUX25406.1 hypothetical protein SOCEGT47_059520 [Sorangium cellulosum]